MKPMSRRQRWTTSLLVALTLVASALAGVWLARAGLARWLLTRQLESTTGRHTTVEHVDVRLFPGRVAITGLRIGDQALGPPLADMGADLLVETLAGLEAGTARPRKQDESRATLAPILKKEDGLIDFSRTATEIYNRLRGFQPWPGAHTKFRGRNLQVLAARPAAEIIRPAELKVIGDRLFAGCAQNTGLELIEIQLEGKKRTTAKDFLHGYRPKEEEKLGV